MRSEIWRMIEQNHKIVCMTSTHAGQMKQVFTVMKQNHRKLLNNLMIYQASSSVIW